SPDAAARRTGWATRNDRTIDRASAARHPVQRCTEFHIPHGAARHEDPRTAAAEAARPRPDRLPRPPLQPPHRGRLPRLVSAVHPLPPEAASAGDGRTGGERLPDAPGDRPGRGRLDPEPSDGGPGVPVRGGARPGAGPALRGPGEPPGETPV